MTKNNSIYNPNKEELKNPDDFINHESLSVLDLVNSTLTGSQMAESLISSLKPSFDSLKTAQNQFASLAGNLKESQINHLLTAKSMVDELRPLAEKAKEAQDFLKTNRDLQTTSFIPATTFNIPKLTRKDQHIAFFEELWESPDCLTPIFAEFDAFRPVNLGFVEIIDLSIRLATYTFKYEIDNRAKEEKDSPNYNYSTNLLFKDENGKFVSLAMNIDYSAGYFRDDNFFFYDKNAQRQETTFGIQFYDEDDDINNQERVLTEFRNQRLKEVPLTMEVHEWLKTRPVLIHYIRGNRTLAKNGAAAGFEFKLSLYLEDMDQPVKLDKDDKPLIEEYELTLDDSISTLFVNNKQVKFPKKQSQQYRLLKYIFTDRIKTDYLNPKLIIAFLRVEKVIDSVAYDTGNLRDTINRLNTKIKSGSDLKDNFLIFDGGKISINKTIKLI